MGNSKKREMKISKKAIIILMIIKMMINFQQIPGELKECLRFKGHINEYLENSFGITLDLTENLTDNKEILNDFLEKLISSPKFENYLGLNSPNKSNIYALITEKSIVNNDVEFDNSNRIKLLNTYTYKNFHNKNIKKEENELNKDIDKLKDNTSNKNLENLNTGKFYEINKINDDKIEIKIFNER